jgi:hypothetical protein
MKIGYVAAVNRKTFQKELPASNALLLSQKNPK